MSNATFFNFDDKPFTGYWDGKPKTFKPGDRIYMPAYLAEHFAKHLTNRYLIEHGQEVYVSPKNPSQVSQFMDVFKRAYIADNESEGASELDNEIAAVQKGPSANIEVVEPKRIDNGPAATIKGPGQEPQIITPPADDEDEGFDLKPPQA